MQLLVSHSLACQNESKQKYETIQELAYVTSNSLVLSRMQERSSKVRLLLGVISKTKGSLSELEKKDTVDDQTRLGKK